MGMHSIDKSSNNMWRSDILGEAIPDPDFNPYNNESQVFMKNLCLDLHQHDFIVPGSVYCWFSDFELYMVQKGIAIPMSTEQMKAGID